MTSVLNNACGNYKCVYGVRDENDVTYGTCKCIPYPDSQDQIGVEKIKTAKWSIHHLRKLAIKQESEINHLSKRLYESKGSII